jgi:lipid A 3-O-deacylase
MKAHTILAAALLLPFTLHAGKQVKEVTPVFSPFDKGNMELQLGAGAFFSIKTGNSASKPDLTDVDASVRLGWMLNTPVGDQWYSGNLEFLAEAFGGVVVDGPGDGLGGLTLLLRYNFVQPGAKLVPYFQIGAGGILNDIHKEEHQRLVGQDFEFNLQAAFGLRFFLNERTAIFGEFGYRHISNADNAERNVGLNSLGGLVGVSYFW